MLNLIRSITPTQWIILGISTVGFVNGSAAQLTEWFGPKVSHDVITGLGFIQGLVGAWVVALTSQGSIVKSVLAMPGVDAIKINAQANQTLAAIATDPAQDKIAPVSGDEKAVNQIAKGE